MTPEELIDQAEQVVGLDSYHELTPLSDIAQNLLLLAIAKSLVGGYNVAKGN